MGRKKRKSVASIAPNTSPVEQKSTRTTDKNGSKEVFKHKKNLKKQDSKNIQHTIRTVKRIPCEFHRIGKCTMGEDCNYSHDIQQGVPNKLCKFYLIGGCNNTECKFSHDTSRFRCKYLFISGKCESNTACIFSHQRFESTDDLDEFVSEHIESIKDHLKHNIYTPVNKYAELKGLVNNTDKDIDQIMLNHMGIEPLKEDIAEKNDQIPFIEDFYPFDN